MSIGFPANEVMATTIPISTSKSLAVDLKGRKLLAILLPAAFTGSNVSLEGSLDGGATFFPVHVDGALYSEDITVSTIAIMQPEITIALDIIKVVSDGTEAAERAISLVTAPI